MSASWFANYLTWVKTETDVLFGEQQCQAKNQTLIFQIWDLRIFENNVLVWTNTRSFVNWEIKTQIGCWDVSSWYGKINNVHGGSISRDPAPNFNAISLHGPPPPPHSPWWRWIEECHLKFGMNYSSPPLVGIPLLPDNCALIREVSFCEREHRMHSQHFAAKNLCPF